MSGSKKIWVLTCRVGYNFGSTLQAYAITNAIKKLGFTNQIINFDGYHLRSKIRFLMLNTAFHTMRIAPWFFKLFIGGIYKNCSDSYIQRRKFDSFEEKYFSLTSKRYKNSAELVFDAKDCDALVCGSDQIWSPINFFPTLFLDFADKSTTTTISYAPSFGVNRVEEHQSEIGLLINNIDFLSVREEQGAKIIKELTNRDAFVALDPTLLFEQKDWEEIAEEPTIKGSYILCYFLSGDNIPLGFVKSLREKTGFQVVNLLTNYYRVDMPDATNMGDASPCEFIGLISRAAYVCTNSYHGAIFSILFSRNFFIFERFATTSKINQNSRIYTLLSKLSLNERLTDVDNQQITNIPSIDYGDVHLKLNNLRMESIHFLSNALKNT